MIPLRVVRLLRVRTIKQMTIVIASDAPRNPTITPVRNDGECGSEGALVLNIAVNAEACVCERGSVAGRVVVGVVVCSEVLVGPLWTPDSDVRDADCEVVSRVVPVLGTYGIEAGSFTSAVLVLRAGEDRLVAVGHG